MFFWLVGVDFRQKSSYLPKYRQPYSASIVWIFFRRRTWKVGKSNLFSGWGMKEKMPQPQWLAAEGCSKLHGFPMEVKAILQELLGDWVGKPSSMSLKASGIKRFANPCWVDFALMRALSRGATQNWRYSRFEISSHSGHSDWNLRHATYDWRGLHALGKLSGQSTSWWVEPALRRRRCFQKSSSAGHPNLPHTYQNNP